MGAIFCHLGLNICWHSVNCIYSLNALFHSRMPQAKFVVPKPNGFISEKALEFPESPLSIPEEEESGLRKFDNGEAEPV